MPAITVNSSDYEIRRAREALLSGLAGIDEKRPSAWQQYGWPVQVTFEQLRQAYERGGPGQGAVHRILDKCWQEKPRIKKPGSDEETPLEKKVNDLLKPIRGWQKLRDFDRRNMVGRYAALIYRVADGRKLSEPLQRATKLVDLVPVFESQLKVTAWYSDEADAENFGKPKMYQYRTQDFTKSVGSDTQGQPEAWRDVHPSRVQILAEGSVGDMFEGVPLLLAGFNALVDIEKISGGSAESYLKNSARTMVFKFDANSSPQAITQNADGTSSGKTVAQVIEEKTDALNRNIDSSIVIQGGEAKALETHQSDPKEAFATAANLFAASVRIPFTILFGQQTGRLASDEDKADFIARCESRQENELTPMLEEFVTRMQKIGLLEAGEFEVEWPPLDAPGDDQKFDQLGKLTTAMKDAQAAGLTEPIFDANELRKVAGFEERTDDGMPQEGDPGLDVLPTDPQQPPAQQQGARPRVVAAR